MSSSLRWLSVVFACAISFGLASCDLNPQPEVPGLDETTPGGFIGMGGQAGAGGEGGVAGDMHGGTQVSESDAAPNSDESNEKRGNYGAANPEPATPPSDQRPVSDAGPPDAQPPTVAM